MNITITINAPELANAINNLAIALGASKLGMTEVAAAATESAKSTALVESTESIKPTTKTKSIESPKPAAKAESPQPENIPTIVELRAKAQEKGKTPEGKKAIKALLEEFGSKSISNVPEEKRAAFLAALEEL